MTSSSRPDSSISMSSPRGFPIERWTSSFSGTASPEKHCRLCFDPFPPPTPGHFWTAPPGITLLSESVFRAADLILIPLVPTPLSVRTFEEIVVFFERKDLDRSRLLPFFSLVEPRKKIHRETMALFAAREGRVCSSFIPSLSDIERMALTCRPVAHFKPRSDAGRAYHALWDELADKNAEN